MKKSTLMHATIKPPEAKATQTLYVMNDGGMVPMRSEWCENRIEYGPHAGGAKGHRAAFRRAPRLFEELALANLRPRSPRVSPPGVS